MQKEDVSKRVNALGKHLLKNKKRNLNMLIIKKNILFTINKQLNLIKLYVMTFNKTTEFIIYVNYIKENANY